MKSVNSRANATKAGKNLTMIRNDATGFTYALTERVNSDTLTCGEGQGAFLVKDAFKVFLEMDSCNYSRQESDYVDAMKALEGCAQNAIAKHFN